MPVRPSDGAEAREVAAADQRQQRVLSLPKPPRAARFDPAVEHPVVAIAFTHLHAGERHTVTQVGANVRTGVLDRAEAATIDVRQARQMLAQATAAAAMHGVGLSLVLIRRAVAPDAVLCSFPGRRFAAGTRAASTFQLTIEGIAALRTIHAPQRKSHPPANAIPLMALAAARVIDPDRAFGLFGVVRAQKPARFSRLRGLILGRARLETSIGRTLDTRAFAIEQDHIFHAEQNRPGLQQFVAAFVERQPGADLEPSRLVLRVGVFRRHGFYGIAVHHAPAVDCAIQKLAPPKKVGLLYPKGIRGQAFAVEILVPQARVARRIGATLPGAASGRYLS